MITLVGTRRFDVHTKRTFMNQFSNLQPLKMQGFSGSTVAPIAVR